MRRAIGITTAEHIATGVVEGRQLIGELRVFEDPLGDTWHDMPVPGIVELIARQIQSAAAGSTVDAIGIGLPGIIRNGFVEECPNLRQLKGTNIRDLIIAALRDAGISAPVHVYNDADALAAGLAATRDLLDRLIRVWTLGNGIGFGLYPWHEGVWEGGHTVVSLDPRERFCACGGHGHLEGIMGNRAMRLRFLDLEPDEIFANAQHGDTRCMEFVKLWHSALAAAIANSVHQGGPGKFFVSGFNAHHLDLAMLHQYLHNMVKMSTLQNYVIEVVPASDEIASIGVAVNALRGAFPDEHN